MDDLEEKVDYRISVYATYPVSVDVYALIVTKKVDNRVLEELSRYGKIKKAFPFLNAVKVVGDAKDLMKLAEKDYVEYVSLIEVLNKEN